MIVALMHHRPELSRFCAYLFVRLLETLRDVARTLSEVNEKWCSSMN